MTTQSFPAKDDCVQITYPNGKQEFGVCSWSCEAEEAVEVMVVGARGQRCGGMFPAEWVSVTTKQGEAS